MMNIVIIGGGTAGWSTAAALSENQKLSITLVEPNDIPTIGVGESTLPLINQFHSRFNLFKDLKWLAKSSATLKFTIDFENFFQNKEHKWGHPFNINKTIEKNNVLENMHLSSHEITERFFYTQKLRNSAFSEIDAQLVKIGAYHLDAKRYAQELKDVALKRGTKLYKNKITQIKQQNNITNALILDNNEQLTADLYIDCSGFNNILFKQLDSEFLSFTDRLFCDSAITVKLPYIDKKKQKINATLCHALKCGWVWHIPLQESITMGYVFSSKHTDVNGAKEELAYYLQERYGYNREDFSYQQLSFRSGTYKDSWIGNNIAIGLSSFFIEPIESTGIALFQIQITELSKILQSNSEFVFKYQTRYNNDIREKILSVKSFIEMHYILSDRQDSKFWRDASSIVASKSQKRVIELYKNREYSKILDYEIGEIFSNLSWLLLLLGMDKNKYNKH